ncbi:PaaX family transcriptional regulator [Demetria terragena]|uniref:PaaX family transcriptional regulator n=1 Tax=Demetria terragena TaxID=63959 RepID=UPI0003774825|nr:PaaX family transcriptional regulator C-terminal domain-containing protein [Demetria terragena]
MHARAAVFDLYGDHLFRRDYWAPIASTVRLLDSVDVRPEAVRTSVSRLVREGWLEPVERHGMRGYVASARARRRLDEARDRIYRAKTPTWQGSWDVLVFPERITDRSRRARLTDSLGFLGYARLAADTWIAPRRSAELAEAVAGLTVRSFTATYEDDGRELAAALWDLEGLAHSYREFIAWAHRLAAEPAGLSDRAAYAVRTELVHEWRKFLFRDPGLPDVVLPAAWPGRDAATCFDQLSNELLPRSRAFVDECLADPHAARPSIEANSSHPQGVS